jgi:hypothetical protein
MKKTKVFTKITKTHGEEIIELCRACLLIKTIAKKEKNVFKIFANTKIIDFNHTCKIKIKHV